MISYHGKSQLPLILHISAKPFMGGWKFNFPKISLLVWTDHQHDCISQKKKNKTSCKYAPSCSHSMLKASINISKGKVRITSMFVWTDGAVKKRNLELGRMESKYVQLDSFILQHFLRKIMFLFWKSKFAQMRWRGNLKSDKLLFCSIFLCNGFMHLMQVSYNEESVPSYATTVNQKENKKLYWFTLLLHLLEFVCE